jgi:hypothetical protein
VKGLRSPQRWLSESLTLTLAKYMLTAMGLM